MWDQKQRPRDEIQVAHKSLTPKMSKLATSLNLPKNVKSQKKVKRAELYDRIATLL
jgi:hypothetical protein